MIEIIPYNTNLENEWDEFVFNSKNGGVFHTQKFLSYHEKGKWKDKSILFKQNEILIGVFAACEVDNKIISHPGSSAGGLVVSEKNNLTNSLEMMNLISNYYSNYDEIIFKRHEYIIDKLPSQEIDFSALKNGFIVLQTELSTVIDLNEYSISSNRLDKIKRASKKLDVRINDNNFEGFWRILNSNLNKKHNVNPLHSIEELKTLKRLFPERIKLITSYYNKELIGGVLFIKVTSKCFHIQYITHNIDFSNLHPTSLLLSKAIEITKKENGQYLNFGISTTEKGNETNKGLFGFKESFGGNGVNRCIFKKSIKKN